MQQHCRIAAALPHCSSLFDALERVVPCVHAAHAMVRAVALATSTVRVEVRIDQALAYALCLLANVKSTLDVRAQLVAESRGHTCVAI